MIPTFFEKNIMNMQSKNAVFNIKKLVFKNLVLNIKKMSLKYNLKSKFFNILI